jgi:hypothetical protein
MSDAVNRKYNKKINKPIQGGPEIMKMALNKSLCLLLCVFLTIGMILTYIYADTASNGNMPDNPFGDVDPNDRFYDDIIFAFTNGLMTGTGTKNPLFSPGMPMTRAMLVTVLYRLAGSPDPPALPDAFSDVPEDAWYGNAVAWAVANGITQGTGNNRFNPEGIVTREQAATFLLRYARLVGKGPVGKITINIDFADRDNISDWALEGAMWCYMYGIMTGKSGKDTLLFDPQGNATRAEIAAMLHRFFDNVIRTPDTVVSYGSPITGSDPVDEVEISFETHGGSEISPVYVSKGGRLSDPPIPVKDDYAFAGWFTDRNLSEPFYSDNPINENMT